MDCVLGHISSLTRLGTTWTNEMNFSMNPAPDAGSIDELVNLQPNDAMIYIHYANPRK